MDLKAWKTVALAAAVAIPGSPARAGSADPARAAAASPASAKAAPGRPNILFILTDDQRWDALGAYGNTCVRTPNLDRLASEGARLDAFYVSAPQCCPSRAGFLSGLYPHQNGVLDNGNRPDLKPGVQTVANYLDGAGYLTGFVGKAHMGGDPRKWGFKDTPMWLPWASSPHQDPQVLVAGENTKIKGEITQIFADSAIQFLERSKDKTWFLWLATTAPHEPLIVDARFPYKESEITAPPGWPKEQKFVPNKQWTMYYSTISMLDAEIGRVQKKLDDLGLAGNTFVFLASDNGFEMGAHGYKGKMMWYEESARVPALVRWPGRIKPGAAVSTAISGVDFLPTVLELAGVPRPKSLEGMSMLPALTGAKAQRDIVFSEGKTQNSLGVAGFWQMVKTPECKYVRLSTGEELLYDLKADPSESRDVSKSAQYGATLTDMKRKLDSWIQATH